MARYSENAADNIYEVAQTFLNSCLLQDGSLLFDDGALWRTDLFDRIHNAFVANPDVGDRNFVDKFRDQIRPLGQEATRLAAELLSVYYLFPSSVGGLRKRQRVNEVLEWHGDALAEDSAVSQAFEHGIGGGGLGYNTHQADEIAFLINFAIRWKALPLQQQTLAANDAWLFQGVVDNVEGAESRQLRHMLLHILFPDHFERIASGSHKRRVIEAFRVLAPQTDNTEDQQILAIRQALEELLPDEDLDFYWPPLAAAWYDNSESDSAEGAPLELIKYKKQIVLYGPPGTGKTYRAKQFAERVIRSAALAQMGASLYFQSQNRIDEAIGNNIHRLQLHPAYSYEDFIRGLHIADSGATEYREGYLLRLIAQMDEENRETRLPHVLILDEMNRTDLSRMLGECFSLLEDRNKPIEVPARTADGQTLTLQIPDDLFLIGTMNLIDQSVEQIDFALRRRFLWLECPFDAVALVAIAEEKWGDLRIDLEWYRVESDFMRLAQVATNLNQMIHDSLLLGSQYEIGHTYFLDVVVFLRNFLGSHPRRRSVYLWNRRGDPLDPLKQVWSLSLRPLLEQYLAGLDAISRNDELERLSKVFLTRPVAE